MSQKASAELAAACVALARALQPRQSPEEALARVAGHAAAGVPGADCAAVAVLRRGTRWESAAHTDAAAAALDAAQIRSGEGPAVEGVPEPPQNGTAPAAETAGPVLHIADTATECRRWPEFAAAAEAAGIRSVLVCRLCGERERLGSLSLYSHVPHAFGEASRRAAELYGGYASLTLAHCSLVDSLQAGLASRQSIGEATGILMERYKVASAEAFGMLVTASQRLNTKLRDIAVRVVETDRSPQEFAPGAEPSRLG